MADEVFSDAISSSAFDRRSRSRYDFGGRLRTGGLLYPARAARRRQTIIANQIAFATFTSDKKVLYITLLAETHDRLFQSLSTLTFFDKEHLGSKIVYLGVHQTLNKEGLSAVVDLLRKETKRYGASLIVFDGLLNARDQAETNLDVKIFIAEAQSQAAFVGCTVLFLTSARVEETSPEHTMVDGVLELHDELVGVRTVRRARVRKSRGSAALGGYHQYEITEDGISVFPRIEAGFHTPSVEDRPNLQPLASGVDGLDELTGGGLPCGSTTLLIGPSGSGKTSFGINFLAAGSKEEPALHFGFYETPERLLLKADALGLGLRDHVDNGILEILWHPLTENLLDKLAYRLLDAVSARGVKRLFLDSFGGFERAAVHRPRLVEFFAALTNELRARGVTTVGTWELRDLFGSELSAPGPEISGILDNLIVLRQVEIRSEYKRALSVLKIRDQHYQALPQEVIINGRGLAIKGPFEPATGISTGIARPLDA